MHLAIGTSLATIVATSTVGAFFHHRHKNVVWKFMPRILSGALVGCFLGVFIAHLISSSQLARIFGAFLLLLSFYLFFKKEKKAVQQELSKKALPLIGLITGSFSSF